MLNWLECSIRRSVSREKRPWLIMTSDFLLTRTRRNSEVSQWTSEFANFLYQEIQLYLDVRVRHSLWIKTPKMRFSFETQQWRVRLKGRLNKNKPQEMTKAKSGVCDEWKNCSERNLFQGKSAVPQLISDVQEMKRATLLTKQEQSSQTSLLCFHLCSWINSSWSNVAV